jgi:hypothetical protein
MSDNGDGIDKNEREDLYVDPKGYWIDPARNLRRVSGEQDIILSATEKCSDLEWRHLFDAIRDCLPKMKV